MNEANMHVVPMPAWCKFTGIARFVIAVLVLAFAAAATGIWGDHTAFSFTLFTVSLTACTKIECLADLTLGMCDARHLCVLRRGAFSQAAILQSMGHPRP